MPRREGCQGLPDVRLMNETEVFALAFALGILPGCARLPRLRLLVGLRESGGSIFDIPGWPFSATR
jgi:hypothetical protein